jgi:predicted permease
MSWDVILFAVLLTLTAGTLFGLIPAWKASAAAMRDHLADGGRHGRLTRSEGIRGTLVVAELALTVMLLIVAGLMARSAYEVEQMPLGFDPDHVLAGRVTLPSAAYREPSAVAAAFDRMVSTLAATPGLDAAGASTTIPLASGNIDAGLTVDGKTFPDASVPFAQIRLVTGGYIEAVNMPLRAGRSFVAADFAPAAAPVVVINQHLARSLWPGESAIGKRISTWTARANTPEWREVVGVIGDVRTFGLSFPVSSELFLPFTQAPVGAWDSFQRSMTLVLRTGDPTLFADAMRRSVRDVDPSVPVYDMSTLAQMLGRSVQSRRLSGAVFSTLALVALGLAAIGIYGLIAFFVSERIPEIGVRLALGATASRVMAMVIRRGMTLTMAGVAIGLAGAWLVSRVLTTLLFGITPTDIPTYIVGTVALLATALVAVALPAYRASRIDPVRSLNA